MSLPVDLRGHGSDRPDGGAGGRRRRTGRRRRSPTATSRSRCWGWSPSYEPDWFRRCSRSAVVAIAPIVLTSAASTSMLGLSRHVYVLATNRQVPSWLGKLGPRSTPHIAILIAGGDRVRARASERRALLAGDLRVRGDAGDRDRAPVDPPAALDTEPDRDRPYRIPFDVRFGGRRLRCRRSLGALLMSLLWLAVLVSPRPRALGRAAAGWCSGWSPTSSTGASWRDAR